MAVNKDSYKEKLLSRLAEFGLQEQDLDNSTKSFDEYLLDQLDKKEEVILRLLSFIESDSLTEEANEELKAINKEYTNKRIA
ncbi:hypothetical protein HN014_07965 [Aquimarina sp. TRL1]|uniref:hypothetical protein n=1 Tax=Aquimarina sp. (strain TRL1) TaxID=2736252 RepID=UPI00158F635A|nr:hypothetical protein [Aquimarina sp. TRL1]QKX04853.1 hypothetical protein HN014_07965 [Aquimarina sp. TRL1]